MGGMGLAWDEEDSEMAGTYTHFNFHLSVAVILGSHSYFHASQDLLRYFPNGICCEQASHLTDNQVIHLLRVECVHVVYIAYSNLCYYGWRFVDPNMGSLPQCLDQILSGLLQIMHN